MYESWQVIPQGHCLFDSTLLPQTAPLIMVFMYFGFTWQSGMAKLTKEAVDGAIQWNGSNLEMIKKIHYKVRWLYWLWIWKRKTAREDVCTEKLQRISVCGLHQGPDAHFKWCCFDLCDPSLLLHFGSIVGEVVSDPHTLGTERDRNTAYSSNCANDPYW